MEARPTVYLLDDDNAVLGMLRHLIETIGVEVRSYSAPDEFLHSYRPTHCECLVSDLRMPGISGLEVQRRLRSNNIGIPIVFVSGFADVPAAVEAMKDGAVDFLEKPFSNQVLLDRVQKALEKSRESNRERIRQSAVEARRALLTPKEQEVLQHVLEGKPSRLIAETLEISVRTVENHRARIMEKLHVSSVVELVKLFA